MRLRLPASITRWVIGVSVVLAVLAALLDGLMLAAEYWMITAPALLAAVGAIYWAVSRSEDGREEGVLGRLVITGAYLVMALVALAIVVALVGFLMTHLDYLILTGLVVVFFLSVFLWSLLPDKTSGPEAPRQDTDIVS